MVSNIQRAQEALENVLDILEEPGARSILTPDLMTSYLDEHDKLVQELMQVQSVEASRLVLVKLWELPSSRTIAEKCIAFKSRVEQSLKSNNSQPVTSNQGAPLPASSGIATNRSNNTDSPRIFITPRAGSDGYLADESDELYSPANVHIPPDTSSSRNGPLKSPASHLAQDSSRPASTATQRQAPTQTQSPVAGTRSRVKPNTSTTETSEGASEDALTVRTPEGVNTIRGISVNGSSVDGFTINLGGHGTSGAYINKGATFF